MAVQKKQRLDAEFLNGEDGREGIRERAEG